MAVFRVFVCLLASAASLKLQGDAPVDLAHLTCQLPIALPVAALNLADDEVLDNAVVVATPKGDALAQKHKVLQDAMVDYKQKKQAFQLATNNLMAAMETLLEVPSADASMLEQVAGGKSGKDALVVFYAPWCPHCQTFVLHNGKGNPEEAPLEIFYKNIKASGADKTLDVVRFDVAANREAGLPKDFQVQHIPTIYMASADGKKTVFSGAQVDSATLVAFIEKNSAKTKKIGAIAPQTVV